MWLQQLNNTRNSLIMGILNVTPDSFSDGGRYDTKEAAVRHAIQMIRDGADIIDIGGESTRPGSEPVSLDEELSRVIPAIEAVRAAVDVPISIDTYKPEVADQAMEAGASIMNDIWGFRRDPRMAEVAARRQCPVILMHNREQAIYKSFMRELCEDLSVSVAKALDAGVSAENIILDPGIGFGKTYEHNLVLMKHMHEVVDLGFPVLLGTSRKTFIRRTLDVSAEDSVEGTAATVAYGIAQGCRIVRVHDVLAMKRVALMMDAMRNSSLGMEVGGR